MRQLVGTVNHLTAQIHDAQVQLDDKDDLIEKLRAETQLVLDDWKVSTEEASNCMQNVRPCQQSVVVHISQL